MQNNSLLKIYKKGAHSNRFPQLKKIKLNTVLGAVTAVFL
jgi:hypothetical protein